MIVVIFLTFINIFCKFTQYLSKITNKYFTNNFLNKKLIYLEQNKFKTIYR